MSDIENDIDIVKYNKKKPSVVDGSQKSEKKKNGRESTLKMTQRSSLKVDLNSLNQGKENGINEKIDENNYEIEGVDSVKSILDVSNEIIIKQEADILEAVTGCQEPNYYDVYGKMSDGEKIHILKCKEFSSCAMRYFCPVSSREFSMKMQLATEEEKNETEEEDFDNPLILISKDCRCPCLCCIRPTMNVIFINDNIKIGHITQSFSIMDPVFVVYDKNEKPIYYIEADCCQCGLMCRNNFMGKTDDAHFFIYDYNDRTNPLGDICKKAAKSMFSIADDYSVVLPTKATFEDKILLMIAGIMIDYQYFEMNTSSK